jgi:prolyl-tRNA synthetase
VVTHHRLRIKAPAAPSTRGDAGKEMGAASASAAQLEADPGALLSEPLVLRPTSETVIWDAYGRWIKSHRDLPLLLNQWANVFRWERRTRPFLRTSEFLWQEGHTAHATQAEALAETHTMLGVYRHLCEHTLAVPVVPGEKSPSERFAGALQTLTCESMAQNGWALQCATSHFLGTNFARAFNVRYTDAQGQVQHVWATSWGASTRLIGGLIQAHADDTGLVLPPAVAPVQIVVVPIGARSSEAHRTPEVLAFARRLREALERGSRPGAAASAAASAAARAVGDDWPLLPLRVVVDEDVASPPGARFFAAERQGIPLRIEVGVREVDARSIVVRARIAGQDKATIALPVAGTNAFSEAEACAVRDALIPLLAKVQLDLFEAARARLVGNIVSGPGATFAELQAHALSTGGDAEEATEADDSLSTQPAESAERGTPVATKAAPASAGPFTPPHRMFLVPWHDDAVAEAEVKAKTKYTIRCFPFGDEDLATRCEYTGGLERVDGAASSVVSKYGSILPEGQAAAKGKVCFYSGREATHMALFARAF